MHDAGPGPSPAVALSVAAAIYDAPDGRFGESRRAGVHGRVRLGCGMDAAGPGAAPGCPARAVVRRGLFPVSGRGEVCWRRGRRGRGLRRRPGRVARPRRRRRSALLRVEAAGGLSLPDRPGRSTPRPFRTARRWTVRAADAPGHGRRDARRRDHARRRVRRPGFCPLVVPGLPGHLHLVRGPPDRPPREGRMPVEFGTFGPLRVREERVSPRPPAPVRVLYASDFHLGHWWTARVPDRLLEAARVARPDLHLLGGDLVDGRRPCPRRDTGWSPALAGFAPVYAVPGNHDEWVGVARVRDAVCAAGGRWLTDRPVVAPVRIDGAVTATGRRPRILLRTIRASSPPRRPPRYDLVFAGHLHGGQCVLSNRRVTVPGGVVQPLARAAVRGPRVRDAREPRRGRHLSLSVQLPARSPAVRDRLTAELPPAAAARAPRAIPCRGPRRGKRISTARWARAVAG